MKAVLFTLFALAAVVFVMLALAGLYSRTGKAPGLFDGVLAKCPDRPNCVCTEQGTDRSHYVEPVTISGSATFDPLPVLKTVIAEMGGRIHAEQGTYLAATFSSAIFRFVDDLEIRVDPEAGHIHVRSASRVGYSDGGVNRGRVEMLKKGYTAKIAAAGGG